MKYREVGNSGIEVSEVGFGTWELGGMEWGDISDEDALEVLRHAYDQGITFYDTANVYGPGRSEELLGQAFAGMDDVIIATKVAFPMDTDGHIVSGGPSPTHNLSREAILTECDLSLGRLQRETIDFYQMHRPPDHHEWDESFGAMEELRAAGQDPPLRSGAGVDGGRAEGDSGERHRLADDDVQLPGPGAGQGIAAGGAGRRA